MDAPRTGLLGDYPPEFAPTEPRLDQSPNYRLYQCPAIDQLQNVRNPNTQQPSVQQTQNSHHRQFPEYQPHQAPTQVQQQYLVSQPTYSKYQELQYQNQYAQHMRFTAPNNNQIPQVPQNSSYATVVGPNQCYQIPPNPHTLASQQMVDLRGGPDRPPPHTSSAAPQIHSNFQPVPVKQERHDSTLMDQDWIDTHSTGSEPRSELIDLVKHEPGWSDVNETANHRWQNNSNHGRRSPDRSSSHQRGFESSRSRNTTDRANHDSRSFRDYSQNSRATIPSLMHVNVEPPLNANANRNHNQRGRSSRNSSHVRYSTSRGSSDYRRSRSRSRNSPGRYRSRERRRRSRSTERYERARSRSRNEVRSRDVSSQRRNSLKRSLSPRDSRAKEPAPQGVWERLGDRVPDQSQRLPNQSEERPSSRNQSILDLERESAAYKNLLQQIRNESTFAVKPFRNTQDLNLRSPEPTRRPQGEIHGAFELNKENSHQVRKDVIAEKRDGSTDQSRTAEERRRIERKRLQDPREMAVAVGRPKHPRKNQDNVHGTSELAASAVNAVALEENPRKMGHAAMDPVSLGVGQSSRSVERPSCIKKAVSSTGDSRSVPAKDRQTNKQQATIKTVLKRKSDKDDWTVVVPPTTQSSSSCQKTTENKAAATTQTDDSAKRSKAVKDDLLNKRCKITLNTARQGEKDGGADVHSKKPTSSNHVHSRPRESTAKSSVVSPQPCEERCIVAVPNKTTFQPRTLFIDQVRTFKSLLILINREREPGVTLSLVPPVEKTEDLFKSAFCFKKVIPGGKVEYHTYILRHLFRDTSGDYRVNYSNLLFTDSLMSITNFRDLFSLQTKKLLTNREILKKFIIYTNFDLHNHNLRGNYVTVTEGSTQNSRKIHVEENNRLYEKTLKSSLIKLADDIRRSIQENSRPINLSGEMKKFHLALIDEHIIEISHEQNSKFKRTGIFHQNFVANRNLSEAGKELRDLVAGFLKPSSISRDSKMNLPENFGRPYRFYENPILRVNERLEKMMESLEVASLKSLNNSDEPVLMGNYMTREELEKITGHILEARGDAIVFTGRFLDPNQELRGNLQVVKKSLMTRLPRQGIEWRDLQRCKFGIDELRTLASQERKKMTEKFFETLEFEAYNRNVEDVLSREVDRKFNEIDDDHTLKFLQSTLIRLLRSEVSDLNILLSSLKQVISQKKVLDYSVTALPDVEFVEIDDTLKKIKELLFSEKSSSREVAIATNFAPIVAMMVKYLINKKLETTDEGPTCVVLKFTSLQFVSEYVDDVLRSKSMNFLIIDCSNDSVTKDILRSISASLRKKLSSVAANIVKKLIWIGSDSKLPAELRDRKKNLCIKKEVEPIKAISGDSLEKFLKTYPIKIRNCTTTLRDLMGHEIILTFLRKPEILTHYMFNPLTIDDIVLPPFEYDEDCQIPGRIKRTVVINPDVLKMDIPDVFLIKGMSHSHLRNYTPQGVKIFYSNEISRNMQSHVRFVLLHDDSVSSFENFAKNDGRNIHLLMFDKNDHFVWQKSSGSIENLIPHKLDGFPESSDSKDVLAHELKDDRIIICGESGSGKSSFLQKLIKDLKAVENSRMWLIQINLNPEYFANYKKSFDYEDTIRHVTSQLNCRQEFCKRLFYFSAKYDTSLEVALIIDGYDELPSDLATLAESMIKELHKSFIKKIYVTARPGGNSEALENIFGEFPYSLQEFTEAEKIECVVKCWGKDPTVKVDDDFGLIEAAQNLLTNFDRNLLSKPLYLYMLAKLNKIRSDGELEIANGIQNIDSLYDTYMEEFSEKISSDALTQKSLKRLFSPSMLRKLGIDKDFQFNNEPERNQVFPFKLDHSTFAEYAVVEWLLEKEKSEEFDLDKIFRRINAIVLSTSSLFFKKVQHFFKDRNVFGMVLHFSSKDELVYYLQALLKSNDPDWSSLDTENTPLHTAVQSDGIKAVKCLLKSKNSCYENILEHGEFKRPEDACSLVVESINMAADGKKAVDLAAEREKVEIACEIALAGADLSSLKKDFLSQMSNFVARHLSEIGPVESHRLQPVAEKLFSLAPDMGFTEDERKTLYPRILPYFLTHGRVNVVERLMSVLEEKEVYDLIETKCCDRTPLEVVNSSEILTDHQRLDITKYLIGKISDKIDAKPKKTNEYSDDDGDDKLAELGRSVLRSCIKFGHTRTFRYFFDQGQKSKIGFLEYCIKTNQFDVVEFLASRYKQLINPSDGNSILHIAVQHNISLKMLKFIVDRIDVNDINADKKTPLAVAIQKGARIQVIKYLLKRGASLDLEDNKGLYPWCYLLVEDSKYHQEEVDSLMQYFFKEFESQIREPPLKNLTNEDDSRREDVSRKLEYYKDPHNYNFCPNNNPRLIAAIKSKKLVKWAEFLILHGANVSLKDSSGKRPLHVAVEYDNYEMTKLLLRHGAIFDELDAQGKTPLKIAHQMFLKDKHGILSTVEKCFSAKEFPKDENKYKHIWNCRNMKRQSLLHIAAEIDCVDALEYLLKHTTHQDLPSCLNISDEDGNAPIHLAVRKGHHKIVEKLIFRGANFEVGDGSNKTPLELAKEAKFKGIVEVLKMTKKLFNLVKCKDNANLEEIGACVKKYPDIVNVRDAHGMTILHHTVISDDNIKILKDMIFLKHDQYFINLTDQDKKTALHYAVEKDHINCVLMLIRIGALIDARDANGRRPFDFGNTSNKSKQMVQRVFTMFEDIQSEDPVYMVERPIEFSSYLEEMQKKYGMKIYDLVNARDFDKKTLLHYAVQYHFPEVAEILLKNGAIYNKQDRLKNEPVKYAVRCKSLLKNIGKLFDKKHLNVGNWISSKVGMEMILNSRSFNGATLLHKAARDDKVKEVEWLVKAGANTNACDMKGRTPANFTKNSKIIEILKRTN